MKTARVHLFLTLLWLFTMQVDKLVYSRIYILVAWFLSAAESVNQKMNVFL